jgi:hypothetical protein
MFSLWLINCFARTRMNFGTSCNVSIVLKQHLSLLPVEMEWSIFYSLENQLCSINKWKHESLFNGNACTTRIYVFKKLENSSKARWSEPWLGTSGSRAQVRPGEQSKSQQNFRGSAGISLFSLHSVWHSIFFICNQNHRL